jgi:ABC-type nitrate/sulfonate/bicarbonate transport system substrate-binding protein
MRNKTVFAFSSMVLSLVLAVLALGGCNPASKTRESLKIVMAPYFGSWLCTYAISNELVTSDAVDVTIEQTASFDEQMLAQNYPIGAISTSAFGVALESGVPMKIMGVYLAQTGLEDTKGVSVVYVRADSSLSSPADLAGKKVGIPVSQAGIASTFLGLLKSEYGVSSDQMTLQEAPLPQLIELLRSGELDAALLLGDPSVQIYYNDAFKVLWNVDEAFEQKYGTYDPASFLAVQSDYLAEHGDDVEAVYDLLHESKQYGEAHLEELAAKYVAEYGGSADFYVNAYTNHYSVTFEPVEGNLENSVMAIFQYIKDRGVITALPDVATSFWTP